MVAESGHISVNDTSQSAGKSIMADASSGARSAVNITKPLTADGEGGLFTGFAVNDGMLMRVAYVLIGLTFVLVIYFGVKFWRLRRRKSNIRRYDVLTTHRVATDIGLDSGSDDELFDDAQAKLVRDTNGTGRGLSR